MFVMQCSVEPLRQVGNACVRVCVYVRACVWAFASTLQVQRREIFGTSGGACY